MGEEVKEGPRKVSLEGIKFLKGKQRKDKGIGGSLVKK